MIKMSWKNILKYDEMYRGNPIEFGVELVELLEKTGFEIRYDDSYPADIKDWEKDSMKDRKVRRPPILDDGPEMVPFTHELEITDRESPYTGGIGYGSLTLRLKYTQDYAEYYSNPRNEDFPHEKVVTYRIVEAQLQTGNNRVIEEDAFMDMGNVDNSLTGRRDLLQRILKVFKDFSGEYEEDWGDMSEEEQYLERGRRAGRRFAGGAWSAGHRENVWDDEY